MNSIKSKMLLKEAIMLLLNEQLLLEVKNKKFRKEVVNNNIITKSEYNSKVFNKKKGRMRRPFNDPIYFQMLYNSAFYDQSTWNVKHKFEHLDEFILMYDEVKEKIIDPYRFTF